MDAKIGTLEYVIAIQINNPTNPPVLYEFIAVFGTSS